ncbi:MAG TPA: Gfo/Idh/MocA family oxidoreductase [Thermomicrobiales bacterium]|nr:Gfo/Idh/MocA family oxidoreductase [Thermomicrobiales bacterium]
MGGTTTAPRPLRLGIIGTGLAVEKLHWPALRQLSGRYTVTAYANHTRPKAEAFAAYSGAPRDAYHQDYRDLLRRDDVDAVLVTLPIALNYPVTRACLEAGKHVICEKPAGANRAQAADFLALAAQFPDRRVLIGENWFYRDDLRLARSLLDEGAIGRLHLMSWRVAAHLIPRPGTFSSTPWRWQPQYRGGPNLDAGVHHVAQIRLLCGDVRRVHGDAQYANATHGGPSDLTLNLRFASEAIGAYTALYADIPLPPEENALRLYGDQAVMTLVDRDVRVHRPDGTVEAYTCAGGDGGYYNQLLDFYDAVVHDAPLVGTIAQSVQNALVVFAGLDAAEGQRVVEVERVVPGGVPLWRPRGAAGLFDGLPVRVERVEG